MPSSVIATNAFFHSSFCQVGQAYRALTKIPFNVLTNSGKLYFGKIYFDTVIDIERAKHLIMFSHAFYSFYCLCNPITINVIFLHNVYPSGSSPNFYIFYILYISIFILYACGRSHCYDRTIIFFFFINHGNINMVTKSIA